MSERTRMPTTLFMSVTAAILTLALPVEAQVPSTQVPATQAPSTQVPSTAPAVKPADTVNLTMEQRHVIKEIIVKEMKITETKDQTAKISAQVGDTIPSGIALQPMPVEVSAKIPQLKAHSFIIKDDKVIIVDPKDNKIAALVD